jgi:ketosteroid isomerase-like protein
MRALALCLLLAPLPALAQTASSRDSAAVAALEVRVEDAVLRGDAAFLDRVYAPTFRFKHATGMLEDRAARMTALARTARQSREPAKPTESRTVARDVDSLEVEVHGDVALTTGRIHVRRTPSPTLDPARQNYTIRYARVYVRRGGAWQLLTHHSTAQTADPPTP